MLVSVSFLKNKLGNLKTVQQIDLSLADYIHVDFMDGTLFGEKNLEMDELDDLFQGISKPLDIHLMVKDSMKYINECILLKPEYISIHVESENAMEAIDVLKKHNIKVGIAISPETKVYKILPYLNKVDLVLILSVKPGLGGQKIIPSTTNKIMELKALQKKYHYLISVDGGINNETVSLVNKSDIIVSGSYICLSDNFNDKIKELKGDS